MVRVPPSRQSVKSGRGSDPKKCDDDNMELFKETVRLNHQEQVQGSTAEHFVAVAVPPLRPRSSMTQMRRNRSGRHVT